MTEPAAERESTRARLKEQIATNVRRELAAAKIPHTSLPAMLGLHRDVAARRYSGEVPYFAYEIAMLAVVLDIPAGYLLDCGLRSAAEPVPVPAHVTIRRAIRDHDDMNTRPAGADQ